MDDAADADQLTVGDIVESFSHREFSPLVLVPALIALIPPVPGIPDVPALRSLTIILVVSQLSFGREHPRLPKQPRNLSLSPETVQKMQKQGASFTKTIDSLSHKRLQWLTGEARSRASTSIA